MGLQEAAAQFAEYLSMEGGQATERAYALRALYRLTGEELHLHRAAREATGEPEAWQQLAMAHYDRQEWRETYAFALMATKATAPSTHCSDPHAQTKGFDLAAVAAWNLGQRPEALQLAQEAVARCPTDGRLVANVESMTKILEV
jgi:hypothetical protein